MEHTTYIARLSYCDDAIVVTFPDLPGCNTQGRDREDALYMAKDALHQWLSPPVTVKIPPPSRFDSMDDNAPTELKKYENSHEFVEITAEPHRQTRKRLSAKRLTKE